MPYNPRKLLKRIQDEYGLYEILGDAMIKFMQVKPQPYLTNALRSKEDFWKVPAWKRALTFVFILRFVLGFKSQKVWSKYTCKDYKLNKRSFDRRIQNEVQVFDQSKLFQDLPDLPPITPKTQKRKSVKLSVSELSTDSPMKRRTFVVDDESTSDSE